MAVLEPGVDIGELDHPGGIGVRCSGVVHLYRTFEGHDVVALQGVDLAIRARRAGRLPRPVAARASRRC